jgi:methylglutaconyl-CoA hydratase
LIGQSSIDEHLISETADWIARVRASDEGREGIKSFLEKRKPSWISED